MVTYGQQGLGRRGCSLRRPQANPAFPSNGQQPCRRQESSDKHGRQPEDQPTAPQPGCSDGSSAGGQPVSLDDMQPGDVVNYYSDASHSAIYIGDGLMVHASTFGVPVAVSPVNNAPIFNVRRY